MAKHILEAFKQICFSELRFDMKYLLYKLTAHMLVSEIVFPVLSLVCVCVDIYLLELGCTLSGFLITHYKLRF